MPLDTGAGPGDPSVAWNGEQDQGLKPPTLDDGPHVGAALREIREFYGLNLEDLAQLTRVRRQYLNAIEELRMDQLPSRPFTIGYVRAYAQALGQNADRAAGRFRVDVPDETGPLRAPVGVRKEGDPRLTLIAIGCVVVVGGIVAWNLVERADAAHKPPPAVVAPAAAKAAAAPPPAGGPMTVGAPLPVPQESTTPKPYVTPGLEGQLSGADPASDALAGEQAVAAGQDVDAPIGSPFAAKGAVYGDTAQGVAAIIQARKPVAVAIHRGDGSVFFARYLAAGEAVRVPAIKGWSADISDPPSADVYLDGVLTGPAAAGTLGAADLMKQAEAKVAAAAKAAAAKSSQP